MTTQQPEALLLAESIENSTVLIGKQRRAAAELRRQHAELTALRADNEKLRTVMVAAAEEIHAHWGAHCDAEGYGPVNLMHRLEQGIPSEYGYTAGAFADLRARDEAAEAKVAAVRAVPVGDDRAVDLLRYFDKHLGTVLQEHQFNVPGGGSLAAHNVRLGLIELQKLFAAAPQPAAPAPERVALTEAARDVLGERQRQISVEGWTCRHDDQHHDGSMALAAACYAFNAATWADRASTIPASDYTKFASPGFRWPWSFKWWKPKSQRQDLVRAAALILAELERIDRAHGIKQPGSET